MSEPTSPVPRHSVDTADTSDRQVTSGADEVQDEWDTSGQAGSLQPSSERNPEYESLLDRNEACAARMVPVDDADASLVYVDETDRPDGVGRSTLRALSALVGRKSGRSLNGWWRADADEDYPRDHDSRVATRTRRSVPRLVQPMSSTPLTQAARPQNGRAPRERT